MTKQFIPNVSKLVLVEDKSVGSGYRFKSTRPKGMGEPEMGVPASLYEVALCKEIARLNEKIRRQAIIIRRHERNAKRRRDRRAKK